MKTLRSRLIRLAASDETLRPHLLKILAEEGRVATKKPVNGTAIRSGYYESGDKIESLRRAVKNDPATKNDKDLLTAVDDLRAALDRVQSALGPYGWD